MGGWRGRVAVPAVLVLGGACRAPQSVVEAQAIDAGASGTDAGVASSTDAGVASSTDAGIAMTTAVVQPRLCEDDGWCWYNPLPQGRDLTAVWGASAGDLWAGVDAGGGVFLHRDATGVWTRVATGLDVRVAAIWGTSATSVWAVGSASDPGKLAGAIVHWDGARWSEAYRAVDANLVTVGGSGPDDVWAVGEGGYAVVLHFDGSVWTVDDAATAVLKPLGAANARVGARARDDVWIATSGSLVHFDGRAWTVDRTAPVRELWVNGTDAFRTVPGQAGDAIERWNGSAWTPSFAVERPQIPLDQDWPQAFGIERLAGAAADDLWAIDTLGTAYHFDGTRWSAVPTGERAVMTDLWAGDRGAAFAVGRWGEMRELVGGTWQRVSKGVNTFLYAVNGTGPDDVWFGGTRYEYPEFAHPLLLHWDGSEVREVAVPPDDPAFAQNEVTALWAPEPGTVWIGGWRGLLARRQQDWTTFAITDQNVAGIWGKDAGDGWLTTAAPAQTFHWQGGAWAPSAAAAYDAPGNPWVTAPDDVWLSAQTMRAAQLRHYDGTNWTIVGSFTDQGITTPWSPGPGEAYIGGEHIRHFKDGAWIDLDTPPIGQLWGRDGSEVWAIGGWGAGVVLRHRRQVSGPIAHAP